MELRELGGSGLKVSALALGTMNFGSDWHGIGAVDEKTAGALLGVALDAGVNLVDTADIYGHGASEKLLGRLLKGRRERVNLASKVLGRMRPSDPSSGGLSARHILEGLDDSLRRLATDRLDLYMPHDTDPSVPLDESLEAFDRARRAGKVRVLGCSNFTGAEWRRCLERARVRGWARFEFNEVQFSLAAPYAEPDLAGLCAGRGLSALAWSPLGGGLLTGKYAPGRPRPDGRRKDPEKAFPGLPEARLAGVVELARKVGELEGLTPAQAALGWVLSRPFVASAVVGARTPEQLQETLAARPLGGRALAILDRAAVIAAPEATPRQGNILESRLRRS